MPQATSLKPNRWGEFYAVACLRAPNIGVEQEDNDRRAH